MEKMLFLSLHQMIDWVSLLKSCFHLKLSQALSSESLAQLNNQKMTLSCSVPQFFRGKNVFLRRKTPFLGNKTVDQRFGANFKINFFLLNFAPNLYPYIFTAFFTKMLKMTILTSVWGAQHPNAGWNIQHLLSTCQLLIKNTYNTLWKKKRTLGMGY